MPYPNRYTEFFVGEAGDPLSDNWSSGRNEWELAGSGADYAMPVMPVALRLAVYGKPSPNIQKYAVTADLTVPLWSITVHSALVARSTTDDGTNGYIMLVLNQIAGVRTLELVRVLPDGSESVLDSVPMSLNTGMCELRCNLSTGVCEGWYAYSGRFGAPLAKVLEATVAVGGTPEIYAGIRGQRWVSWLGNGVVGPFILSWPGEDNPVYIVADTAAELAYPCVNLTAGSGENFTDDNAILDFSGYDTTEGNDGCLHLGEGGS